MALSSPSKTVAALDKGRLSVGISASATTIYVSPIFKTVSGVRTKQGFDSTAGECIISQGDFQERISFESSSVNATTKITTLSTCTRGLPFTNTTANFTGGTGRAWNKGAYIAVVDAASYNQSGVYTNVANTFTSAQTFNAQVNVAAPVVVSGTSSYIKLPELTTTQRDALTPTEGMLIKNSTTGTNQQYTGGAWSSVGTDATANASTTVAGKAEEAILSELSAGTAAGGTGARLFINPSLVKKTSSGAAEGNVVALNSATMLDGSIGGTGVASPVLGALLIGGGAGAAMTSIGPGSSGQVPVSNGTTIAMGTPTVYVKPMYLGASDSAQIGASSTAIIDFDTHTYTILANDLISGVAYEVEGVILYGWAAGSTIVFITLGTTNCASLNFTPADGDKAAFKVVIRGTAAAGASVAVRTEIGATIGAGTKGAAGYSSNNLATNGTLAIKITNQFQSSNGANNATLKSLTVKKISTTAF